MASNPYPALMAPRSGGDLLSPLTPYSDGNPTAPEQSEQQLQPYPARQRPHRASQRSLRVRSPKASEQSGQLLLPQTPQRPHSGGYPAASGQQGQLLQPPPPPQRPHDGGYPAASGQQGQLLQLSPTPQRPHDGGFQGQWLQSPPKPPKPSSRENLATLQPQNFSASKQPFVTSETESPEPTTQEPTTQKPTTHTKEQREAISRVLNCDEKNYYKILKLPPSCNANDIRKSYRKLSLSIHPDRNKFSDASKAFKRIQTAYAVLSDLTERQAFDRLQASYQPNEDLFGEEFHENAYGNDSEIENSDEGNGYDADRGPLAPDETCMEIYEKATPYIRSIQRNVLLDDASKAALDHLNKEIGEHCERNGITDDRKYNVYIEYGPLGANMDFLRPYAEKLNSDPNNGEALRWVKYYQNAVTKFFQDRGYPKSWAIARNENGEEVENDVVMRSPGVTSEAHAIEVRSALQKSLFKPGFTSEGERILGCSPVIKKNRYTGHESFEHGYFVVEKRGELNPIALFSSADLGYQAVQGYLDLPEEQKCDLRETKYVHNPQDTRAYRGVIGFASNPLVSKELKSGFRYPVGYALVTFDYGSGPQDFVMNRGKLRKILGERKADSDIARFYKITGLTPPWEVEPRSFHDRQRHGVKKLPWNQPRLLTYGEDVDSGSEYYESGYESEESNQDTGRRRLGGQNEVAMLTYGGRPRHGESKKVAVLSDRVDKLTAMLEQLIPFGPSQQQNPSYSFQQARGEDRQQGWGQDSGPGRGQDRRQGWGQDSGPGRGQDGRQGWGQDSGPGRGKDGRQGWGQDSGPGREQDGRQGWGQDSGPGRGKGGRQGWGQDSGHVYDKRQNRDSGQRSRRKDGYHSPMMTGTLLT
ncbi:hypothetical protein V496_01060 [Pseudogymnoascus sp. VKM F-4515 (FW-2607)]|nr:hypothetical protein V496_01060 [Pseudogymnoascus sp. VKM F-4515 (FW-2607)]